jgi:hypothetical protein
MGSGHVRCGEQCHLLKNSPKLENYKNLFVRAEQEERKKFTNADAIAENNSMKCSKNLNLNFIQYILLLLPITMLKEIKKIE